jgi:hypothetical protein
LYAFLISLMRTTCLAHFILLDLITLIIFCVEYKLWRSEIKIQCGVVSTCSYLNHV